MLHFLYCLASSFFIYSIILYYSINLKSLIIFCYCSGDIHLSLNIYSLFVSELLVVKVFETLVSSLGISFPIKSPVASAVLWIAVFEAVLSASVADCLAWLRSF